MSHAQTADRRPPTARSAALLAVLAAGWLGASAGATPAAPRAPAAGSTTLVVNEIDYTQPGGKEDAEFVELKNVSANAVDLTDHALLAVDNQGFVYRRDALPAISLAPGDPFVVCGPSGTVPGCDLVANGTVDLWHQGSVRGQPVGFAVAVVVAGRTGDLILDTVAYDGPVPAGGGQWTETSPVSPADNDTQVHLGISRLPDGNDTDVNSRDLSPRCITPGGQNTAADGSFLPCAPPATSTPTATPTSTPSSTATDTVQPTRTLVPSATPTPRASDTPRATATPRTYGLDLVVDSPGDGPDVRLRDGLCDDGNGACTLRAALMELNDTDQPAPYRIRFRGEMRIDVREARPLPALARNSVRIVGLTPPAASGAVRGLAAPGPAVADAPAEPLVTLAGPGGVNGLIGWDLDGVKDVTIQGLRIEGFRLGVFVHNGANANVIGSGGDGAADDLEANRITANLTDGVLVDGTSASNRVAGNRIDRNRHHGIHLVHTARGDNHLSRNAITANGAAAIGVTPLGAQLAPPVITDVENGLVVGTGCPGCTIELFSDPGDEARTYLGMARADGQGTWAWPGPGLPQKGDVSLTATGTDGTGNTSRLSEPMPLWDTEPWSLVPCRRRRRASWAAGAAWSDSSACSTSRAGAGAR